MLTPLQQEGFRRAVRKRTDYAFDESLAYCEDEQFIPALPVAHAEHGFRVVREDLYTYEKRARRQSTRRYVPGYGYD